MDGGGIRGLVLLAVLLELEAACGKPIQSCFDWIAGTSTGGILALALGMGNVAFYIVPYCQSTFCPVLVARKAPRYGNPRLASQLEPDVLRIDSISLLHAVSEILLKVSSALSIIVFDMSFFFFEFCNDRGYPPAQKKVMLPIM